MAQNRFWTKMKGWMRPSGSVPGGLERVEGETSDGAEPGQLGAVPRWRRNEAAIERLQEGYQKVIELVDAIKQHQDSQDMRASEISNSLAQVSGSLGSIETAEREQADKLARIADELQAANERAGRWGQVLSEFPKTVEAQREALTTVVQQLEMMGERDGRLAGSLESLREAVTSLGDATTASSVAVKSLQMASLENQERTAALVQEQNKRFTMLFAVTLVLVAIAIVVGLAALWQKG